MRFTRQQLHDARIQGLTEGRSRPGAGKRVFLFFLFGIGFGISGTIAQQRYGRAYVNPGIVKAVHWVDAKVIRQVGE